MYRWTNRTEVRLLIAFAGATALGALIGQMTSQPAAPPLSRPFTYLNGTLSCTCMDTGTLDPCEYFPGRKPPHAGENGGWILLLVRASGQLLGFRCLTGQLTVFTESRVAVDHIVPVSYSGSVSL